MEIRIEGKQNGVILPAHASSVRVSLVDLQQQAETPTFLFSNKSKLK